MSLSFGGTLITNTTISFTAYTVKPVLSSPSKGRLKIGFHLMQVKRTAECSKRAFCNTFDLHISYHLSLRPLFCLVLSGRLRQVLLYQCDKTFCFLLMRAIIRSRAMIFNVTLMELSRIDIGFQHFQNSKIFYRQEKNNDFIEPRSISFIGNRSLFFITQY